MTIFTSAKLGRSLTCHGDDTNHRWDSPNLGGWGLSRVGIFHKLSMAAAEIRVLVNQSRSWQQTHQRRRWSAGKAGTSKSNYSGYFPTLIASKVAA